MHSEIALFISSIFFWGVAGSQSEAPGDQIQTFNSALG